MIVFFSVGTTFLAYPYLYLKADSLLVAFQEVTGPLKPYLIKILVFLFGPRRVKLYADIQDENVPSIEEMGAPVVEGWQVILFKILGAVLGSLIALAALAVLIYGIIRLMKWMLKKNQNEPKELSAIIDLRRYLKACLNLLLQTVKRIMKMVKSADSAALIYYRMLRWGKISGLAARSSDTPKEYGRRLMQYFPDLNSQIELIVEAFNREVYGQRRAKGETLNQLISAQRHMRRIRYWPSRMRIWFHHSE